MHDIAISVLGWSKKSHLNVIDVSNTIVALLFTALINGRDSIQTDTKKFIYLVVGAVDHIEKSLNRTKIDYDIQIEIDRMLLEYTSDIYLEQRQQMKVATSLLSEFESELAQIFTIDHVQKSTQISIKNLILKQLQWIRSITSALSLKKRCKQIQIKHLKSETTWRYL